MKNVVAIGSGIGRKLNKRMVDKLLALTGAGDPFLNQLCMQNALLSSFEKVHVALLMNESFFMIGRHGYIESVYTWRNSLDNEFHSVTEFLDVRRDAPDFELWPETLSSIRHLIVAPIFVGDLLVGYCGVASTVPASEPSGQDTLDGIDTMSRIVAKYLSDKLKIHESAQFLSRIVHDF